MTELAKCLIFPYYIAKAQPLKLRDTEIFDFCQKEPSYAISKDYDLQVIKKLSKQFRCTVNDLITNIFLEAYSFYSWDYKTYKPYIFKSCIAINFRKPLRQKADMTFFNNLIVPETSMLMPMYYEDDTTDRDQLFRKLMLKNQAIFTQLKNNTDYRAILFGSQVMSYFLPTPMIPKISPAILEPSRRTFSNICGPAKPYQIGGVYTKRMHFRDSIIGRNASVNYFSHNGIFRVSMYVNQIDYDVKKQIEIFEKQLDYWIDKYCEQIY
ncbi:UNKNOWN [Stylonychia lemnae]|uniref:Uncharacterized protein n=1 Tax=Stylonychia lemnae TaxID=5949 RepID=A0A078AA34_STYLE|nr:UNKNOWN [Stylonychia lemnae]|eukprot:CDW79130.1 UNKNOWN [Stylonychia lemnae]